MNVRVAKRLTNRMGRNHVLKERGYTTETTLETEKPREESVEAFDNPIRDKVIHKVYRAALRKMIVHADRDGIALLVHPKIVSLSTDIKESRQGFRGVVKLRIEAEAYTSRN